jgi:hypothetical protein
MDAERGRGSENLERWRGGDGFGESERRLGMQRKGGKVMASERRFQGERRRIREAQWWAKF